MKFGLVYVSPNGTTKLTTELLEKRLKKDGHSIMIYDLGCPKYRENHNQLYEDIKDLDIIGFGSPVYKMDMLQPMKIFLSDLPIKSNIYNYRFKAFVYLTYGGITSGKAFLNAAKVFKKSKISIIGAFKVFAPHFHHNELFPTNYTVDTINEFYKEIKSKDFKKIEWKRIDKLFSPDKLLVNLIYPFTKIIGKSRELPINFNSAKCKRCKKCINECPVCAITLKDIPIIDHNKCIHCYHCATSCPFEAIECPVEELDKMITINKKIIGTENPVNKIYI